MALKSHLPIGTTEIAFVKYHWKRTRQLAQSSATFFQIMLTKDFGVFNYHLSLLELSVRQSERIRTFLTSKPLFRIVTRLH